jgi:AraC-like DNA-binding protein
LNALLTNLWNQRQSRQQAFRQNPDTLSAEELEVSDIDREFIEKAITIVQQNISSPQLDVEFLASELCMSRSTLTRKLRSVTGDTPLDFIKAVKLKHAYRLLQQHRYSVIEVIEAVGYNDRHTFSQSFKDMFGVTPSKV